MIPPTTPGKLPGMREYQIAPQPGYHHIIQSDPTRLALFCGPSSSRPRDFVLTGLSPLPRSVSRLRRAPGFVVGLALYYRGYFWQFCLAAVPGVLCLLWTPFGVGILSILFSCKDRPTSQPSTKYYKYKYGVRKGIG